MKMETAKNRHRETEQRSWRSTESYIQTICGLLRPGTQARGPRNDGVIKDSQLTLSFISLVLFCLYCALTYAAPPFISDNPAPVKEGNWALYLFSAADKTKDETNVFAPAIELDRGVIKNLELHLLIPMTSNLPRHGKDHTGLGDTEVGIKYRFIEETNDCPQVGFVPLLECPTGNKDRNLGNGRLWVKLPLWLQKSWDKWTTYGGGGYAINTAPGQRNFPYAGWVLQRDLNDTFTLGGEFYYQGRDSDDTEACVILNGGGYLNFTNNFSLLFSAGHTFVGERHLVSYFGLYWTW